MTPASGGSAPPAGAPLSPGAEPPDKVLNDGALLTWLVDLTLFRWQQAVLLAKATQGVSNGGKTLLVSALVDFEHWLRPRESLLGRLLSPTTTNIAEQMQVMVELARLRPADAVVHPMVAYDPARAANEKIRTGRNTALEVVRTAVMEQGAIGVKLYPPMGFWPMGNSADLPYPRNLIDGVDAPGPHLEAALHELYAFCNDNAVPIMTHCGDSNQSRTGYGPRSRPDGWRPVLECYPRIRINLGHFGGVWHLGYGEGELMPIQGVDRRQREQWTHQTAKLIVAFPGRVFADLSYADNVVGKSYTEEDKRDPEIGKLKPRTAARRLHELVTLFPAAEQRTLLWGLMYGSDWNLVAQEDRGECYAFGFMAEVNALGVVSEEVIRNIMSRNAARFLGLTKGNPTRKRLFDFNTRHGLDDTILDEFDR